MTDFKKLTKNYYLPYDQTELDTLYGKIIKASDPDKLLLLKKYTPLIKKLSKRFKELVLKRNTLAKKKGFQNYFDFISDFDGIPKDKLENFLKNGDKTAKNIFDNLPARFKDPDWLKGNYNNLNFDRFVNDTEVKVPGDVFDFISKRLKAENEILSKIILKKTRSSIFTSNSFFKKKTVVIEYSDSDQKLTTSIGLAHEFGHAIEQVRLMEKGIDPDTKSFYYHEVYATDVEMKFAASLSSDAKKARIGNFLYTFANTFFEEEIYKNPDSDFEVAYAKSRNKVCPQLKQIKNPFYVFNTFLVEYPCFSTNYSVIYNEYLTKSKLD